MVAPLIIPLHIAPDWRWHAVEVRRYELHVAAAQVNPRGFRQPSANTHRTQMLRGGGTSSVEKRAIRAEAMDPPQWTRSARGKRKLAARLLHIESVKGQQKRGLESRAARKRAA